jgi:hypothetical protein
VSYESVVITEDRPRWLAAGSPPVPTLVLDGTAHALQHPGQAAALLGLETPASEGDARQVAWDVDAVVEAWLELAARTPWEALLQPLPRLRRTPLALAVDTFIGIQALTDAFTSGWFHWPGNAATGETGDQAVVEYEASIVAGIGGRTELLAFLRPVAAGWRRHLGDEEHAAGLDPGKPVRAPRGELSWLELLEAQRLHAAQHYRQATTFVRSLGHPVPDLDLGQLHGLHLPSTVY